MIIDLRSGWHPRPKQATEVDEGVERCSNTAETSRHRGILFEEFAREYVACLVKPSVETRRKYLERLALHVFPVFGHRPVQAITRRELRLWQSGLVAKGLSAKTIANIRGETVSPILEAACESGEDDEPPLRAFNPLKGLPLPDAFRRERDILETEGEVQCFLQAAYDVDYEAAELLVTKLATGMRWGEIAGLPVRAVHSARGTVSVCQSLVRVANRWLVQPRPKTVSGYREIPVPVQIMAILNRRIGNRDQGAFVFCAPAGNFWRYSQFYDGRWVKIRERARELGMHKDLTMHRLRHSMLTMLAASDVDLVALSSMAGHKHISTTLDLYVHARTSHHFRTRDAIGNFIGALPIPGRLERSSPASRAAVLRDLIM